MKIRTDFVTNSSSSSFIFGLPGENSLEISDVVELIKKLSQKLLDLIEYADTIILQIDDFKELRENTESRSWGDTCNFRSKLTDRKDIKSTIEVYMKDNQLKLTWSDFTWLYVENNDIEKLKNIVESDDKCNIPLPVEFIKLSDEDVSNFYDARDLLEWYWDDLNEDYKEKYKVMNSDQDVVNAAHGCLGEVAMTGYCGDLPDALVNLLYDEVIYGCNHMG